MRHIKVLPPRFSKVRNMPQSYRIQSELQLAAFRLEGTLSVEEGADIFLAYFRDPAFDPRHVMVTDARGVTEIETTFLSVFTRVIRLAPELAHFREPVLSVILVSSQTVFGYARMLEQILDMTAKIRLRPVWTIDEALALLDRPGLDLASVFPD